MIALTLLYLIGTGRGALLPLIAFSQQVLLLYVSWVILRAVTHGRSERDRLRSLAEHSQSLYDWRRPDADQEGRRS